MRRSIYIGWDPREADAFAVARHSLLHHLSKPIPIHALVLADVQGKGLYTRPTERRDGRLIDTLSIRAGYDGSISTEHANARFLVKELAHEGWVLFCDCDVLFRADVAQLFDDLDPQYPLYCVQHDYTPSGARKMDGQPQSAYPRKNWSSLFVLNVRHPANAALTVDLVNSVPGRDLHRFCWLDDAQIGALDPAWNYLVGESNPVTDPKMVHFTLGLPSMPGYESCEYADEWRAELMRRAA